MANWKVVLELDSNRKIISGSEAALCEAVHNGADLRIYTEFYHNEHIDTASEVHELIKEVSDFPATYLLNDQWAAGIMTLRKPVTLPDKGFGSPSMSFFLYNQNGQQAIARPHLNGNIKTGPLAASPLNDHSTMPKYHEQDCWDSETNAPSSNFIYDFEVFRFCVWDEWEEVLSHSAAGDITSGSVETLVNAFAEGKEVKVGVKGLCADLSGKNDEPTPPEHELFIQLGPGYYYTDRQLFIGESRPLVRVAPQIPLRYESANWDFGWIIPRTDGTVSLLLYDPYTLQNRKLERNCAIRWFIR
jgi:hypothetical protein